MATTSAIPAEGTEATATPSVATTIPTIKFTTNDLKNNPALWYKIHVFTFDLRNFSDIPTAQARLDQIVDASYIGMPYFTGDEVEMIKSTIVDNDGDRTLETAIEEMLNERLERRLKKRTESNDYRVCAAHDLAPIFEQAFGIKRKELAKDRAFLKLIERSGLELKGEDKWAGIGGTKSFAPRRKGKKR